MLNKRITGCTHIFGSPKDWDTEANGPCLELTARFNEAENYYETGWELLPDEAKMLEAGGTLVLRLYAGQPAVALYVEPFQELPT